MEVQRHSNPLASIRASNFYTLMHVSRRGKLHHPLQPRYHIPCALQIRSFDRRGFGLWAQHADHCATPLAENAAPRTGAPRFWLRPRTDPDVEVHTLTKSLYPWRAWPHHLCRLDTELHPRRHSCCNLCLNYGTCSSAAACGVPFRASAGGTYGCSVQQSLQQSCFSIQLRMSCLQHWRLIIRRC